MVIFTAAASAKMRYNLETTWRCRIVVNCTRLESVILHGIRGFEPLHLRPLCLTAPPPEARQKNSRLEGRELFVIWCLLDTGYLSLVRETHAEC